MTRVICRALIVVPRLSCTGLYILLTSREYLIPTRQFPAKRHRKVPTGTNENSPAWSVAECRVWEKDDWNPALAGRLNLHDQEVTASDRTGLRLRACVFS